ncbi:hypothetical protein WJX79_004730 [Trebouxia sp. C0005]
MNVHCARGGHHADQEGTTCLSKAFHHVEPATACLPAAKTQGRCSQLFQLTCRSLDRRGHLVAHLNSTRIKNAATRSFKTSVFCKKNSTSRPTLDDVERISKGNAAKARGTGSRRIPHRLNAEERQQYDIAKQKGFLTLRGTGYRKERKGSPLANTFRQWCDAQAIVCIVIEQGFGSDAVDTVLVDLSTLRSSDTSEVETEIKSTASNLGCSLSQQQTQIPFTIEVQNMALTTSAEDHTTEDEHPQLEGSSSAAPLAALDGGEAAAESNDSSASIGSQGLQQDYTQLNSKQRKLLASSSPLAPIWTIEAHPIFFDANRPTAKELAKALTLH